MQSALTGKKHTLFAVFVSSVFLFGCASAPDEEQAVETQQLVSSQSEQLASGPEESVPDSKAASESSDAPSDSSAATELEAGASVGVDSTTHLKASTVPCGHSTTTTLILISSGLSHSLMLITHQCLCARVFVTSSLTSMNLLAP